MEPFLGLHTSQNIFGRKKEYFFFAKYSYISLRPNDFTFEEYERYFLLTYLFPCMRDDSV
jgi:hypothetical protein